MKVLLKQARIINPSTPFNGQTKDILIADGKIASISDDCREKADQVISLRGLCVSPGWMDVFAHFGDPGFEHNESIETGSAAAAAGGFTDVMLIPNTHPVVHNKSQVEYLAARSSGSPVTIHPIGAVTRNAEGQQLAEMYDMKLSGALAFGDGIQPIQSPGILLKALQYIKAFNGTIIQMPGDASIAPHGLMNEGIVSTRLGLPGIPAIAEELMIARDIELVRYTGSRIHFTGVSTIKGLELIAAAKASGLSVTCSVTAYHGFFCDEDLVHYDTNLKLNPPLRTRTDMMAIREALSSGVVDCLATHHLPQDLDHKQCEFEYAKNGMTGLETQFAVMNTMGMDAADFVQMQSINARQIFRLPVPELAEGAQAVLTLFNPEKEQAVDAAKMRSRSKNNPFTGMTLKGSVLGIINKNQVQLNN